MYVTDEYRKVLELLSEVNKQVTRTEDALDRARYAEHNYKGEQMLWNDLQYAHDQIYDLIEVLSDSYNDLLGYEGQDGMISFSKRTSRKFASEYNRVSDLPEDYQLITDSQEIESTLDMAGKSQYSGDAGCLFISYDDPDGGVEGFRLFLCENSVPGNNDSVWEIYPNDTYGR